MPGEVVALSNACHAECDARLEAARIVAESNHAIADAIRDAVKELKPAADFFGDASHRLTLLCSFMRRKGPWILGSAPVVLVSINAISPDAAKGIHNLLVAFDVLK